MNIILDVVRIIISVGILVCLYKLNKQKKED